METVAIILNILKIIIGIVLLIVSVDLIKTIKNNPNKTVENISDKINKELSSVAVLAIAEAVLCTISIIMK